MGKMRSGKPIVIDDVVLRRAASVVQMTPTGLVERDVDRLLRLRRDESRRRHASRIVRRCTWVPNDREGTVAG